MSLRLLWLLLLVVLLLGLGRARANSAAVVVLASSELTLRTTASVDIQVCAGGILSDERAGVQAAILATLQYALGQTSAVYLARTYTTAQGAACFLYVYQAPSPTAANEAEVAIQNAVAAGATGGAAQGPDTLTVQYGGTQLACTLAVAPWQGEDPPLPVWGVSAPTLVLWATAGGGALAACLLAACCFVLLAGGQDAARAKELLATDRDALRRALVRLPHHAAPARPPKLTSTKTTTTTHNNNNER